MSAEAPVAACIGPTTLSCPPEEARTLLRQILSGHCLVMLAPGAHITFSDEARQRFARSLIDQLDDRDASALLEPTLPLPIDEEEPQA